jgi:hypothetical protein
VPQEKNARLAEAKQAAPRAFLASAPQGGTAASLRDADLVPIAADVHAVSQVPGTASPVPLAGSTTLAVSARPLML